MTDRGGHDFFVFPRWTTVIRPLIAVVLVTAPVYVVLVVTYGFSPRTLDVGYQPEQPLPYSHGLHVGELGLDCRYCHTTVEVAGKAAIPPTQTCMNCHSSVRTESPILLPVRESSATGVAVPWIRVHDLPDYVYFNHSAHVRRGVGCVSCHGRVDMMVVVRQEMPLSMGWCLDCHRHPEANLRPPEVVTSMGWVPPDEPEAYGARLREAASIDPSTECWTCHR